jgi:hypothetical protein
MSWKSRQGKSKQKGSSSFKGVLMVLGLFVVAVIVTGFFAFDLLESSRESIDEEIVEIPRDATESNALNEMLTIPIEETRLASDTSAADIGFARRGVQASTFTHVAVVTLPAINEAGYLYEGWLVQPGTLEFFSTGEMVQRADGAFALVYEESIFEVNPDVYEFSNVVITLEPRDGNPDPAPDHVARGAFVQKEVNLLQ